MLQGVNDKPQDMFDVLLLKQLKSMESSRYLHRKKYRRRALDIFNLDSPEDSLPGSAQDSFPSHPEHLTDAEFLNKILDVQEKLRTSVGSYQILSSL